MTAPTHRRVVVLKKIWIGFSIAGGVIFLALIFYNFYQAAHLPVKEGAGNKEIRLFANEGDIDWYHTQANHLTHPAIVRDVSNSAQAVKADLPTASHSLTEAQMLSSVMSPDMLSAMMAAPISSNQLMAEKSPQISTNNQLQTSDLNALDSKMASLSDKSNATLSSQLQNPSTPYMIQAGTLIPGILITGIYSDLPGPIIAQVRAPVYDSISGEHLLIPQGAKLTGVYDTQVAYGQERLFVVWKRLLLPNGQNLDLQSMPGVDVTGTAGFYDHTNHHYAKLFGSAVLTSILGAGAACNSPSQRGTTESPDPLSTLSKSMGETAIHTGLKLTERNMDLQPSIEIRPGYHFQLAVTQDMVFESPYRATLPVKEDAENNRIH